MANTTLHRHIHKGDTSAAVPAPVIAYVVIVMACGILGNGLVLLVYGRKIQKLSNYRSFVLMLAWVDMTQSCIGMPGILVDMLNYVTFYSNTGCKLLRLVSHIIISASLMTHLLIGIERHRKICKPLKRQITSRVAKLILLTIVLSAFVIGLPAYMFYGRRQIEVKNTNITLNVCFITDDYENTIIPIIYEVSIVVFLVLTVLILFLIYVQITRKIWKTKRAIQPFLKGFSIVDKRSSRALESIKEHFSDIKQNIYDSISTVVHRRSRIVPGKSCRGTNGRIAEANVSDSSKHDQTENHDEDGNEDAETCIHVITGQRPSLRKLPSQIDAETDMSDVFHSRISDQNDSTTSSQRLSHLNNLSMIRTASSTQVKRHSRKVTAVSFAITFVFIISYVPHFAILIYVNMNTQHRIQFSSVGEILYRIGYLSYILNNAANFPIYYIMDKDFKEKCKQFICWGCHRNK